MHGIACAFHASIVSIYLLSFDVSLTWQTFRQATLLLHRHICCRHASGRVLKVDISRAPDATIQTSALSCLRTRHASQQQATDYRRSTYRSPRNQACNPPPSKDIDCIYPKLAAGATRGTSDVAVFAMPGPVLYYFDLRLFVRPHVTCSLTRRNLAPCHASQSGFCWRLWAPRGSPAKIRSEHTINRDLGLH